jgi:NAD(P)-dependent dehydrogenase (short-subunit alcohol dehydrogenase family)
MRFEWQGKVALVTGASSGIGQALARGLARRGCKLALAARRSDRLEALAAELKAQGVEVLAQACDVTVDADRASLARAVEERFGGLQLLSNNAGILLKGLAGQEPLEAFRRNMETNYFAPIDLTQRCLPMLRRSPRSWVAFTSSGLALRSTPGLGAYCATKSALEAYAESLRAEEQGRGVRVLVLRPDLTATDMVGTKRTAQSPEQVAEKALKALQAGRGTCNCTWRVALLAHIHEPLRQALDWGTQRLMKKGYLP